MVRHDPSCTSISLTKIQSTVDEAHISVRFKHGIHTIYLFVDALGTVSTVSSELCELLRERYPDGLTTSLDPPKKTHVPAAGEDFRVVYAVLNMPNDPTRGWKRIKKDASGSENAADFGLKPNGIVAFAFLEEDENEEDAVFEVEWPKDDDEMYE